MHIITDLGNPGRKYEEIRHNTGFEVINHLAAKLEVSSWEEKHRALTRKVMCAGERLPLLKPRTYMNLSGENPLNAAAFYRAIPDHILMIPDDIDLVEGRLWIRRSGSAGGYNGLKSIISNLGSDDFICVYVGVGSKPIGLDLAGYALGYAKDKDAEKMEQAYRDATEIVLSILEEEVDRTMNKANRGKQG